MDPKETFTNAIYRLKDIYAKYPELEGMIDGPIQMLQESREELVNAIDVAHKTIESIYSRAKHSHTECGIDKMVECALKDNKFFGDIVSK